MGMCRYGISRMDQYCMRKENSFFDLFGLFIRLMSPCESEEYQTVCYAKCGISNGIGLINKLNGWFPWTPTCRNGAP